MAHQRGRTQRQNAAKSRLTQDRPTAYSWRMKKPLVFEPIKLEMSAGTTTLQRSHLFSDALELVMSPLDSSGQFRTIRRPQEIDSLIDALQKGKAAMIEAQTLKLSDLAYGDIFRFATDGKDSIRKNTGNRSIANWITPFGERIGYPEDPLNASVVRVKVTFEDVTE